MTRKITAIATLASFLFLAGCGALSPFQGPGETTPPPVKAGVWLDIEKQRSGNWQLPLNEGTTALDWRLRAIDSATRSIDLQSFIWSFDKVGSIVQDRLLAAADRDVDVRILIDDSFLLGKDQHLLELHRHPNVQYRVYNPYKRRSTGAASRLVLNLGEFDRLDHRMHNKSMVIDNQVAIMGGRNLADEYFGYDDKANFRDMELLVGGPVVEDISRSFDEYWNDRWSFPVDAIVRIRRSYVEKDRIGDAASALASIYPTESADVRQGKWFDMARSAYTGRARLIVDAPPAKRPRPQATARFRWRTNWRGSSPRQSAKSSSFRPISFRHLP
jgi:putative cardiolipin synthase